MIENRKNIALGYELQEITTTKWILSVKGNRSFTGTLIEVGKVAVKLYDISVSELDLAVQTMLRHDHNTAHFGINSTFTHTSNKGNEYERKAS